MKTPIWSVGEITATYKRTKASTGVKVTSSKNAVDYLRTIEDYQNNLEYKEYFYALYLSKSNMIIGYSRISEGGLSGTVADPKMVVQNALLCNASSVIISHNHPSGELTPSGADMAITKKIKQGCEFLDIQLLDHVIITRDKYYSMADEGIL